MGNASFELESTDKAWLDDKEKQFIAMLEKLSKELGVEPVSRSSKYSTTGSKVETGIPMINQTMTANEFYVAYIKANDIKTRPQIALLFVYFLEKVQKKTDIKTGDVTNCFKEIGYPAWSSINVTDILNQNKKRGHLNFVNSYWSFTTTALDYIANKISSSENE